MSLKKNLKKSALLGALMAFVITGNAHAAGYVMDLPLGLGKAEVLVDYNNDGFIDKTDAEDITKDILLAGDTNKNGSIDLDELMGSANASYAAYNSLIGNGTINLEVQIPSSGGTDQGGSGDGGSGLDNIVGDFTAAVQGAFSEGLTRDKALEMLEEINLLLPADKQLAPEQITNIVDSIYNSGVIPGPGDSNTPGGSTNESGNITLEDIQGAWTEFQEYADNVATLVGYAEEVKEKAIEYEALIKKNIEFTEKELAVKLNAAEVKLGEAEAKLKDYETALKKNIDYTEKELASKIAANEQAVKDAVIANQEALQKAVEDNQKALADAVRANEKALADVIKANDEKVEKAVAAAVKKLETGIQNGVGAEALERIEADEELHGRIDQEILDREAADEVLQGQIDDLDGRVTDTENAIVDLDGRVTDTENAIVDLDGRVTDTENAIVDLDGRVTDTENAIVDLDGRVTDTEEAIEQNQKDIATNKEDIAKTQQAVAYVDNRLTSEVNRLDNRIDRVEGRVDKVGAMAAAMASLKTMGYDPEAPTEIAVGVGQYRNETGIAIGAFHYPNKNFMLNFNLSTSSDEVMGGVGATWKIGRKKPEGNTMEEKVAKAEAMKAAAKAARLSK